MTKSPPALRVKPATAFRECLNVTVILSYVSAGNCYLNRLNLWFLFFRWVAHGKSAACKKLYQIKLFKKVCYILLFYVLDLSHFPFNLGRTKTIENINVWKRTETGSRSHEKGELRNRSHADENQEVRSRSQVYEKKSSGAVSFLFYDVFLCHFYDGSAVLLPTTKVYL